MRQNVIHLNAQDYLDARTAKPMLGAVLDRAEKAGAIAVTGEAGVVTIYLDRLDGFSRDMLLSDLQNYPASRPCPPGNS